MDLKRQPGEWRSDWGWRLLMHDLRNPEQPEQPVTPPQQPTEQPKSGVTNIINNYSQGVPMQLKRFNFASVFAIILTVSLLIIVGLVAWNTGAIQHIINVFRSLL